MARDNFAIKLTNVDGSIEHIMVHNICRMSEVAATDKEQAHTLIQWGAGYGVKVKETVVEIEQKGKAYGIFKIINN